MSFDADVVIIGAGAVGLACARSLAGAGLQAVVLERHDGPGQETSSRNSGVVHAGIYYPPGSLKAALCVAGNASLWQWCAAHRVPFRKTGKYIVAVEPAEEAQLETLLERGLANGAGGLARVSLETLRREEPHVHAVAAVHSPSTGILDVHGLFRSLALVAEADGASFAYRHTLLAASRGGRAYHLTVLEPGGQEVVLTAERVVNAAGLDADEVAALTGLDVDALGYRQRWSQGRYFRVRAARAHLARHLVYPVEPEGAPTLGIHVTLDLDGQIKLGPDSEWLPTRVQRYDVREELRTAFHRAAARYLPELAEDDLSPDQAGIRPKLTGPDGGFRDFVIAEESGKGLPGWVNLLGIESPGLTSCLEIARKVGALLGVGST